LNITPDSSVGELVKLNFRTAQIFQANKIEYCCKGNKAISDACNESEINPEQLIRQLETVLSQNNPDSEYLNNLELNEICSYIVRRHHAYVHENSLFLKRNFEKLFEIHGAQYPELLKIIELFNVFTEDYAMHMQKEEIMLFPYIHRLETAKKENSPLPRSPFRSISDPIVMMLSEHQNEGQTFNKICELYENLRIPGNSCSTYEVTLKQLKDFGNDLHIHIQIENNILFPRTIELIKA
jgi:regulator of cell morphogenesis and NO signaling